MVLPILPVELVFSFLAIALRDEPTPSHILCASSGFLRIGQLILYEHLIFRSLYQLAQFSKGFSLPCAPRSITLDFTGKSGDFHVFKFLRDALQRIKDHSAASACLDENGMIPLTSLSLRLHSYARDTSLDCISDALRLISPESFTWTGPDPEHHFSTAIVAPVSMLLFRAFEEWSNIQHIKLSNIAFCAPDLRVVVSPLLPSIPTLRTLYIGQATFLSPFPIAAMFSLGDMPNLQQIRLVDTYMGSIWGPRLRRDDIETAYMCLAQTAGSMGDDIRAHDLGRIRNLVQCEKQTERIMGGDRVEGSVLAL